MFHRTPFRFSGASIKTNLNVKILGLAGAAAAALLPHEAAAQSSGNGIGAVAGNLSGNFDNLGKLLLNGALLVGLGLCAAGLLKLKQAADDGGQRVKYSEGLWRLGVGGGMVALPFVTGVMKSTLDNGVQATSLSTGSVTFSGTR